MIDRDVSPAIYDLIASMGGTFSAEYGLGQDKLELANHYLNPASRDLMRRIKLSIDPKDLMNPGKVVDISQ